MHLPLIEVDFFDEGKPVIYLGTSKSPSVLAWALALAGFMRVLYTGRIGIGFCGGSRIGEPGEKPSAQGENQQQTQPTQHQAGIEPGPHWWEASALNTAPSAATIMYDRAA